MMLILPQNNCRRMKMRCVGADEPPCKRCRNSGLECIMEKPGKSTSGGESGVGEEYVESLIVYPQNLTVVIVAYDRWRAKCLPSKILFPTWSPLFAPVFPLVHRILQATHLQACLPPLLIMPPLWVVYISLERYPA